MPYFPWESQIARNSLSSSWWWQEHCLYNHRAYSECTWQGSGSLWLPFPQPMCIHWTSCTAFMYIMMPKHAEPWAHMQNLLMCPLFVQRVCTDSIMNTCPLWWSVSPQSSPPLRVLHNATVFHCGEPVQAYESSWTSPWDAKNGITTSTSPWGFCVSFNSSSLPMPIVPELWALVLHEAMNPSQRSHRIL